MYSHTRVRAHTQIIFARSTHAVGQQALIPQCAAPPQHSTQRLCGVGNVNPDSHVY